MNIYIQDQVFELLDQFDAGLSFKNCSIIKAETLTPDSWAVRLYSWDKATKKDSFYVLYIEDYIDSLRYIKTEIEKWHGAKILNFIKPKEPMIFTDTDGALYYADLKKHRDWEAWAVGDDNYAFLATVHAPNGEQFWGSAIYSEPKAEVGQTDPTASFVEEWKKRVKNGSGQ